MFSGDGIRSIRERLGLTQEQLARLLGVHPLTVSKWERGLLQPTAHQEELLRSFRVASRDEEASEQIRKALAAAGTILALYLLLKAALKK